MSESDAVTLLEEACALLDELRNGMQYEYGWKRNCEQIDAFLARASSEADVEERTVDYKAHYERYRALGHELAAAIGLDGWEFGLGDVVPRVQLAMKKVTEVEAKTVEAIAAWLKQEADQHGPFLDGYVLATDIRAGSWRPK